MWECLVSFNAPRGGCNDALQDRGLKIITLDGILFSSTWGYGVSKVRELYEKLELPTEDKNKVSMPDVVTNAIIPPGFDSDELANFCDQESDTFDDFDVAHGS